MNRLSICSVFTTLLLGLLAVSCSKEDVPHRAPPVGTSAPPPAMASQPLPAFDSTGVALPADCEAFLDRIDMCASQPNITVSLASQLRKEADQVRKAWGLVEDRATLAAMCRQSVDTFAESAKEIGCK